MTEREKELLTDLIDNPDSAPDKAEYYNKVWDIANIFQRIEEYALNLVGIEGHRIDGKIQDAQRIEKRNQKIYELLPEWVRW